MKTKLVPVHGSGQLVECHAPQLHVCECGDHLREWRGEDVCVDCSFDHEKEKTEREEAQRAPFSGGCEDA